MFSAHRHAALAASVLGDPSGRPPEAAGGIQWAVGSSAQAGLHALISKTQVGWSLQTQAVRASSKSILFFFYAQYIGTLALSPRWLGQDVLPIGVPGLRIQGLRSVMGLCPA